MEAETSLAERAVACKHWRWVPGMLGVEQAYAAHRVARRSAGRSRWCAESGQTMRMPWADDDQWLPDLDDPATIGCLLALVREAWGGRKVWAMQLGGHWRVGDGIGWVGPTSSAEDEALVAALEAAPGEPGEGA